MGSSWRLGVEPTTTDSSGCDALGLEGQVRVVRRLGGGIGAATHLVRSGDQQIVIKQYPLDRRETVTASGTA